MEAETERDLSKGELVCAVIILVMFFLGAALVGPY